MEHHFTWLTHVGVVVPGGRGDVFLDGEGVSDRVVLPTTFFPQAVAEFLPEQTPPPCVRPGCSNYYVTILQRNNYSLKIQIN